VQHLVPALGSAESRDQDRAGFAVQNILKLLADNHNYVDDEVVSSSMSPSMPQWLGTILSERGIEHVTEPFWHTKYEINDASLRLANTGGSGMSVFKAGMQCARWLQLWTRHLITKSSGILKPLFDSCRAVVRFTSPCVIISACQ